MWSKKVILTGIDGDNSLRVIEPTSALNLMNGRVSVSANGRDKRVENVPGTELVSQSVRPPYGYDITIGSALDPATSRIIFCNWNSVGDHGIYCLDMTSPATPVIYAVLYDSQTESGFGFDKNYRIDRNCHVTNGLFYWTDNNNQPRKVNIDSGIKANHSSYVTTATPYSFPLAEKEITLIKPPPSYSPNIQKATDATFENNFIGNDSFEFCFLYDYYDGERTVNGAYSPASRLNKVTDTENYIIVSMDALESVPSTVKMVHLAARKGDGTQGGGNYCAIVKTWDKSIQSERNEIIEQNNGTQVLSFDFYNNITGEIIPPENVLKPYDDVARRCKTLASARNRNFIGNILKGYDTPTSTSLSLSSTTVNIGGTVLNKNLIGVQLAWLLPPKGYSAWYVFLTASEALPAGYYELTSTVQTNSSTISPSLVSAPPSIAFTGLNFRGATQSEVAAYVRGTLGFPTIQTYNTFSATANVCQVTGLSVSTYDIFKTASQYKMGIVFYDRWMRKCGVVTNDGLVFEIPGRNFAFSSAVNSIVWTLDNTDALTEIPDWAYYYSVVRTLNLKTRFFIDGFTNAPKYATKDSSNVWQFNSNTFVTGSLGLALNQTALIQAGLGYTFSEGDIAIVTLDDNTQYEFPVIAQDGVYVIVKTDNLGDLSNRRIVYEIYTPYQTSEQEPFYEIGQIYRIANPGTDTRAYETLSDIFVPDAYVLTRNFSTNTYFAEAMCPNDRFYQRWDNDGGKVNFVTTLGEVEKTNFFQFSNTYIPGTSINGLSTFEPLNEGNISEDSGEINKLILTTKVLDEGTVMLAICKQETNSIYLGEQQISGSNGKTQFFAKDSGVVGTINSLKKSFGTANPETVFEYLGLVFWLDTINGVAVQYSEAGLEPVSRFNMTRFFQNYCSAYLQSNSNNLDNINGFHHIPSCIDPFYKEVIFGLPGLIYENYADVLSSYSGIVPDYASSIIDRFDVYDQLAKTMAYKYQENNWGSNFEYGAEWYDYIDNILIGFKNGGVYIHNKDTSNTNNFYGTQKPVRVCVTFNDNFSEIKDVESIAVEGSDAPNYTVLMSDNPNAQITDLANGVFGSTVYSDYTNQEGVYYAQFFKDRLSPNATGTAEQKLYTGDIIKSPYPMLMCEFQAYDGLFWMDAVTLQYKTSRGQKQIITKL